MLSDRFSVVEFLPDHDGHSCGYCRMASSSYSHGMWAHRLTVQDYQDLIDRGWRRSGQYCYKPIMDTTCCPLYTIRCDVLNFKLSKSQKKILKEVNKFLKEGKKDKDTNLPNLNITEHDISLSDVPSLHCQLPSDGKDKTLILRNESLKSKKLIDKSDNAPVKTIESTNVTIHDKSNVAGKLSCATPLENNNSENSAKLKIPRSGIGRDLTRPQCKKAKLIRLERKQKKLAEMGMPIDTPSKKGSVEKSIEDFLQEAVIENPSHNLELKLVQSSPMSPDFELSLNIELELYQKYQESVHKDPPGMRTMKQFKRFLVNSPLMCSKDEAGGLPCGYGSFHQQYWLDGKLIAVGVIDVLPKCVSSVYFFYDPDYAFLSLGTYGSLREVELARSFQKVAPQLNHYYMGFYIHTCPKMRYKAQMNPSYLLCPEAYTWHPVQECLPKLEVVKYSRLNDDKKVTSPNCEIDMGELLVIWKNTAMKYRSYLERNPQENEMREVSFYAKLVGRQCAERMYLWRS